MPPHGRYGETRGVRWDRDLGCFVMRCDDCVRRGKFSAYYPLDLFYWNPRTLQRCRACDKQQRAQAERDRLLGNEDFRAHRNRISREYYWKNRDLLLLKQRARRQLKEAS